MVLFFPWYGIIFWSKIFLLHFHSFLLFYTHINVLTHFRYGFVNSVKQPKLVYNSVKQPKLVKMQ